jgi:hypothetical protein
MQCGCRVESGIDDKVNSRLRRSIGLSFKSRFQSIESSYESYTGLKAMDGIMIVDDCQVVLYLTLEC